MLLLQLLLQDLCAKKTPRGNFYTISYLLNSHHSQFHIHISIIRARMYIYTNTQLHTYHYKYSMSLICCARFTLLQSAAGSSQVPCTSVVVSSACRMSCRKLSHIALALGDGFHYKALHYSPLFLSPKDTISYPKDFIKHKI